MSLPYQCVAALGQDGVVAAARGTCVFTFGAAGSLVSSWEHPATQRKVPSNADVKEDDHSQAVEEDGAASPSKKRKVETGAGVQAVPADTKEEQAVAQGGAKGNDQKKTRRGRNSTKPSDLGGLEQPYISLLKTTSTGSHLIAVTGTDKAVWVFEHDGKGQLKELSQR